MSDERIALVPDDWTVWAFSDPHGVASGLEAALIEAGVVNRDLQWRAPPHTAVVGCGDYLDRGADSRRVIGVLRYLEPQATAADGRLILTRGNHEEMVLHLRAGRHEWLPVWLAYGGHATLQSYGIAPADPLEDEAALRILDSRAPGLFDWLTTLAQAVRWRDVLFVHGGLPAGASLDELGVVTDLHLWVRREFYETSWDSGAFDRFVADGVERVVFGHTPWPDGIRVLQGGRLLAIDSNACGNPRMPPDARRMVTLVEMGDESFARARRVVVPTDDAPDRALSPEPADPMLDYRSSSTGD
jgi:serine/threonine protein phosphatase 1